MKLLAQFYACLAIIVFITVIGGIEARSTVAGYRSGLSPEQQAEDQPIKQVSQPRPEKKVRRSAPVTALKESDDYAQKEAQALQRHRRQAPNPGDASEKMKQPQAEAPKRQRRQAPQAPNDKPEKPQADQEENKRVRRQLPGGNFPSPEDMAKQIPSPGRK